MTKFLSLLSVCTLLASTLFLAPASAAASNDCDGSTADMHECMAAKMIIADKELNTVYQAIRKQLTTDKASPDPQTGLDAAETERRLVKAQRAWVAFRDADCDYAGTQMLGGSGEGLVIHSCRLEKTEERVKDLKEYLPSSR